MHRNHWVTSDVQFRKGASIPPFWVGLGWADQEGKGTKRARSPRGLERAPPFTWTCTRARTYTCTRTHTHVRTRTHAHTSTQCMHTRTYITVYTHATYAHKHVRACTHTCAHTQTHAHVRAHTRALDLIVCPSHKLALVTSLYGKQHG